VDGTPELPTLFYCRLSPITSLLFSVRRSAVGPWTISFKKRYDSQTSVGHASSDDEQTQEQTQSFKKIEESFLKNVLK
jgi:hypothetical protein